MGDTEPRRNESDADAPGLAYMRLFVGMEDLLDKLKLLGYDKGFCTEWGFKPFSRHYFAIPTNPGEQFFNFISIVVWLLNQNGIKFERPQEYDDPNATVSEILSQARSMGIPVDFPPSKLKGGSGEQVVYLLGKFADQALSHQHFTWHRPEFSREEEPEENFIEDDAELTMEKVNDELAEEFEEEVDEEEGGFLDLTSLKQQSHQSEMISLKPESVLEPQVNADEWKLEVERVLPLLQVHIRTDNKDWRNHYEQMKQYSEGINKTLQDTQSQLDKLHAEISKTLEKIASREKYINSQLERLIQEYRGNQDKLTEVKEKYRSSSGGVNELSQKLAQVSDELEQVKQQMEERGTNMTDSGPLVRIKQALSKLKQETTQMELRIGVLEHSILQGRLREKIGLEVTVNKIKSAHVGSYTDVKASYL